MSELSLDSEIRMPAVASQTASQLSVEPVALADVSPQRRIEDRYVAAINALVRDASDNEAIHVLVDVLTWQLAGIALNCGAWAAGDILRRFGNHRSCSSRPSAPRLKPSARGRRGGLPN